MSMHALMVNWVLALTLFFLNGVIGLLKGRAGYAFGYSSFGFSSNSGKSFAGNFYHAVIHPALFLAIVCSVLDMLSLNEISVDLWLVVPFYWVLRFLHTAMMNRTKLINWRFQIPALIVSNLLGEGTLFLVIRPLIAKETSVFVNLEQFRDAFWYAAIAYSAMTFWGIFKEKTEGEHLYPVAKKRALILSRYNKFKKKYDSYLQNAIREECAFMSSLVKEHFCCLFYAVMIYEDHNRPFVVRVGEYICKALFRSKRLTLGIMQVRTDKLIGDKRSIKLAVEKLYASFSQAKREHAVQMAISDYNTGRDYQKEVYAIYHVLMLRCDLQELEKQRVKVRKVRKAIEPAREEQPIG